MKSLAILTTILLLLHAVFPARAGTKTWDGSSSTSWNIAGNWTNNAVPVAGDDLLFPAGAGNKDANNNIPNLSVRSITFTDSGYALRGIALTLTGTNGISANQASGSNVVLLATILLTNATVSCATAGASLGIIGNITNVGHVLTGSGSGLINYSNHIEGAAITGAGTFTKLGTGTNRFSGGIANTFTGDTIVAAGTLELRKTGSAGAVAGDLAISAGATVRQFQAAQIADASDVTVGGSESVSGLLDLNNQNETIGALTLSAGVVNTGSGTLTLGGDVTASAVGGISPRRSSITGNLALGAASRTFNVANNLVANPDLAISANISGAGFTVNLIKSGAGQMELSGVNTY